MINLLNLMCFFGGGSSKPAPLPPPTPDPPAATADVVGAPTDTADIPTAARQRRGKRGLRLARKTGLNV